MGMEEVIKSLNVIQHTKINKYKITFKSYTLHFIRSTIVYTIHIICIHIYIHLLRINNAYMIDIINMDFLILFFTSDPYLSCNHPKISEIKNATYSKLKAFTILLDLFHNVARSKRQGQTTEYPNREEKLLSSRTAEIWLSNRTNQLKCSFVPLKTDYFKKNKYLHSKC